ncbi:MAG: hypothetical protein ABI690_27115 [Chloroflexota bacterium]
MAQQSQALPANWIFRYMLAAIGVVVAIIVVIFAAFRTFIPPLFTWIILLALFSLLTVLVSRAYTGRWLGLIIDDRNKYSLSRLQMVMWTLIVLSAFLAAVLANVLLQVMVYVDGAVDQPRILYFPVGSRVVDVLMQIGMVDPQFTEGQGYLSNPNVDLSQLNLSASLHDGEHIYIPRAGETLPQTIPTSTDNSQGQTALEPTTPLSVEIPSEVWLLLGISTTSLVASPLIKGQKANVIQTNEVRSEAKLSDLFSGEEESNYLKLDLAKLQMLFFTLIVIGAYGVAVASLFNRSLQSAITSLPALDSGVVAMLGVSHAGYLTNKAIPKPGSDDGGDDNTGDTPPTPAQSTIIIAQTTPTVPPQPVPSNVPVEPDGSVG